MQRLLLMGHQWGPLLLNLRQWRRRGRRTWECLSLTLTVGSLRPLTMARKVQWPEGDFLLAVRFSLFQCGSINPNKIKFSNLVLSFPLNRLRRCSRVKVTVSSKCVPPPPAGSSTDVSEDWEKDFDLDMTEEEVQMALSKIQTSGEVSICLFT